MSLGAVGTLGHKVFRDAVVEAQSLSSVIFTFSAGELVLSELQGFMMVGRGCRTDSFPVGLSVSDQFVKTDGQVNQGFKGHLVVMAHQVLEHLRVETLA